VGFTVSHFVCGPTALVDLMGALSESIQLPMAQGLAMMVECAAVMVAITAEVYPQLHNAPPVRAEHLTFI
jgi:hypothetical protein